MTDVEVSPDGKSSTCHDGKFTNSRLDDFEVALVSCDFLDFGNDGLIHRETSGVSSLRLALDR